MGILPDGVRLGFKYSRQTRELPNDVLLDVQRILETEAHDSVGPWDNLLTLQTC